MKTTEISLEGTKKVSMTLAGFEPAPMKTTALTLRLRPLGHRVGHACVGPALSSIEHMFVMCVRILTVLVFSIIFSADSGANGSGLLAMSQE